MAIVKPVSKTSIATAQWGNPVTDETNRLTTEGAGNVTDLSSISAKCNEILNPVWFPLPLAANFTPYGSGYGMPAYAKVGSWVLLRGLVKYTGATALVATTTFATLPTDARPPVPVSIPLLVNYLSGAGSAVGKRCEIGTGGGMTIWLTANTTLATGRWIAGLDGTRFTIQPNV